MNPARPLLPLAILSWSGGISRPLAAAALRAGQWQGKYASVNHHEYFAVGVAAWYGHNRFNDFDHNHMHPNAD